MTDELSEEQIAAARAITEERFNELIAGKAQEHEAALTAAQDKGFAAGAATAPGGARKEYSNGALGAPVFDLTNDAYESELRVVVNALREAGVRNVKTHPNVLAVQSRHDR